MKRITQIDPSTKIDVGTADDYYETVHSPFARESFLRDVDDVVRYGWNRVQGEYDLCGGFDQRPSCWRFIISEWAGGLAADSTPVAPTPAPPELMAALVADHVNFLQKMRPYDVVESTFFDAWAGQMSMAKFIFTFRNRDLADERHREILSAVAAELRHAVGARRALTNQVVRQLITLPIEEPGQRYGTGFVDDPELSFIDEYYFDNLAAGVEFFSRPSVRQLLSWSPTAGIRGFHVKEWLGFDRRQHETPQVPMS